MGKSAYSLLKKIKYVFLIIAVMIFSTAPVAADEKTDNKEKIDLEEKADIIEDEPIILDDTDEDQEKPDNKIENNTETVIKTKDIEEKTKDNGWYKFKSGDKLYYRYKPSENDKFYTGRKKIGNNYYYFDQNGRLLVNQWIRDKNKQKQYYSDKNGILKKGWSKIADFYYFFDKSNKLAKDLIKEFGEEWYKKQDIYIKVNKYHNCVTIYGKSRDKKYNMPIKSFPCTSGYATYLLTTKLKKANTYRWHELMGPTYGQFCTRIHKGVLFHSVLYRRPNKYALNARQYNKLGITASHGCIRLAVVDAKRIYDDVKRLGEVWVTIYNDKNLAGPLDKPQYPKVSWNQRFDPTDPTIK